MTLWRLRRFEAGDLGAVLAREPGLEAVPEVDGGEALDAMGPAYTGLWDGSPVVCGGLIRIGGYQAVAWLRMAPMPVGAMRRSLETLSDMLNRELAPRIEARVRCDWNQGHKLVRLLGFHLEYMPMRKFFPDGADAAMYVRLR